MKITKLAILLAFLSSGVFSGSCLGQQPKVFNWLPANDESVRLDPANYHTGLTYHTFGNGGNIQVDIKAERPITIFLTRAEEWKEAPQHPEAIANLRQLCLREHVVETRFVCFVPPEPMTLIIQDERNNPDAAVFAGLGAVLDPHDKVDRAVGVGIATVLTGQGSLTRRFDSPNDVHVQYYRWDCVENCVQPEFRWTQQIKEKYDLTSFLKVPNCGPAASEAGNAGISAREKCLPATRRSILAVRVHLQFGRWSTVADCCTRSGCERAESQESRNPNAGGEMRRQLPPGRRQTITADICLPFTPVANLRCPA